jgi:hypothetical protein
MENNTPEQKIDTGFKDRHGNPVFIGDMVYSPYPLHCNHGFSIDLSEPVTVRVDEQGVIMAGGVSLKSFRPIVKYNG